MKWKSAAATLLAAVAAGCAQPAPRKDPFIELARKEHAPLRRLRLAVALTPESREALASLESRKLPDPSMTTIFHIIFTGFRTKSVSVMPSLDSAFKKYFGETVMVDRPEEAKGAQADLVALLELDVKDVGGFGEWSMAVQASFLDTDQRLIDRVRGEARSPMPSGRKPQSPFERAGKLIQDASVELNRAIAGSSLLLKFAEQGVRRPPAQAEAAAVPAEPAAAPSGAELSSDVDKPRYKRRENPESYAIVIGIEDYQALPAADFAGRDAAAVRDHLLAAGYPEKNIVHLRGQQAGLSGMKRYVEEWLARNAGPRSTVFFYFSGHGAPDPVRGDAYLVPWDGDAKFIRSTGYPLKKLYRALGALKVKRVIVALDACFSGAGGRSVLAKGARPLVVKLDTELSLPKRLEILSAASGEEITGTIPSQGHGIFTYYFLKGLNGAGKNPAGWITMKSLYEYLKPRVQDEARRQNRDQTPVLAGAGFEAPLFPDGKR